MTLKVYVHHFHAGNDPDFEVRKKSSYCTLAKLVDVDTGVVLDTELARCSPKDNPTRAKGRQVAIGRLLKRHPEVSI